MSARQKSVSAATHAVSTRHRLIEETAKLCIGRGGGDVSVAEIAAAAGVFPNQVTYHFGSKDSLLVHAAFYGLLHDSERLSRVGDSAGDAAAIRRKIARTTLALPALPAVSRALAAGIAKPELAPTVDTHLDLLFRRSERYLERLLRRRGWSIQRDVGIEVRTFWSTALGAVLLAQAGVSGSGSDLDLAGVLTFHE
ncbi:TetR family transcriptional regulator [Mycetocola tolaasinivorans]|uniref:TetR family transcriptional regulator n=1 Tax=Mycetocola tolaasinivorans TaxID=76635 RepID=A0A3L7AC65_9MICO|nr:TetR/AcrR family transcriptional regulator C-terminal domain-containing protein [Mycetocola tolaasinivorans]RLP77943.1 TetR family transcriptional regulator [Mycetocola tolaasinivorans]